VKALVAEAGERDAQVLAVSPRPVGEGTVGMDEEGNVVRLRGRVFGREVQSGDYVGVMALGPHVVANLPQRGCLMADVALPCLAAGGQVGTLPSPASWTDLGDLSSYVAANFRWLDAGSLGRDSWLAEGVSVPASIEVSRSLLGAGTRLSGRGRLTEVIAWPGAPVLAPLSRAVVLGSGQVVPFDETAEN
jgi:mannose-1-phosphate guanylyltransferase